MQGRFIIHHQLQIGKGPIQFRPRDHQQARAVEHQGNRRLLVTVRDRLGVAEQQAAGFPGERVFLDRRRQAACAGPAASASPTPASSAANPQRQQLATGRRGCFWIL